MAGTVPSGTMDQLLLSEQVKKEFQRIDSVHDILKSITYTDVKLEAGIFLSPLYLTTVMDRNLFGTALKSPETVDNILRKNIYYLASTSKNVKNLTDLVEELLTIEEKMRLVEYDLDSLKSVCLFIIFLMKSSAELSLSKLIEILTLSGNDFPAKILTDAMKLLPNISVEEVVVDVRFGIVEGAGAVFSEDSLKNEWACENCTFLNENGNFVCAMCSKSKDFFSTNRNSCKQCIKCTFINLPEAKVCEICSAEILETKMMNGNGDYDDDWKSVDTSRSNSLTFDEVY